MAYIRAKIDIEHEETSKNMSFKKKEDKCWCWLKFHFDYFSYLCNGMHWRGRLSTLDIFLNSIDITYFNLSAWGKVQNMKK